MMLRQTRNLLGLVCMALMALATVEAAINGCGDMFLRSSFAEIGISSRGYQNSDCAAPGGFHPSSGNLGFMYDRYEDGDWNTKVGDFSLPGTPEMRFGLTGASSWTTVINGMAHGVQIPTFAGPYETVADRIGAWVGRVNFLGTTLEVTKQWDGLTFAATGIYITVTITNVGSSPTSEAILYFESHDPDNDVDQGGDYVTTNSVVSNGGLTSDGVPYWQVTARGDLSGADTAVYYFSYDTRSFVSSDPTFSPSSAYNIINGNKGTLYDDTSIGIAADLGFLNTGESVSYNFYLGFGTPSAASVCTPPTISCSPAFSVVTLSGTCSAPINYVTPIAVSCLGDPATTALSSGPAQGSFQNVGSYTAVWSAGASTCDIPITVVDDQDPSASCPSSPVLVPLAPGTCSSSVYNYASLAVFSDNCAIDTSRTSFTGPSRVSPIPVGTYTVTATAYDFASRSVSCSFTLIVSNNAGRVSCDTDGDGIDDDIEGTGDTDGDGTPDYLDTDADGDGIPDSVEGTTDTDGDGTPDNKDLDSDGDGIPDSVEGNVDTDHDGIPDFRDLDSDGDGIPDSVEGNVDTDHDGVPDYKDVDSDADGIPDSVEGNTDTDGDGIPDYKDPDSDNDGIPDNVEGDDDSDNDGVPDFRDNDSDNDGVLDAVDNCPKNFNPDQKDSDSDGKGDACSCSPDTKAPVLKCLSTFTVSLNAAPFAFEVAPSSILTSLTDNCGFVSTVTLDKSVFNLRDSVAPVTAKVTGTDPSGNEGFCTTSITTKIVGSIITNPSFSLLSIKRGKAFVLTWSTNVQSFTPTDKVTIKLMSSTNVFLSTVVNAARFTTGSASVTFPTSLSPGTSYKLAAFINDIPAGVNSAKFV
jgi:hypothetical protein